MSTPLFKRHCKLRLATGKDAAEEIDFKDFRIVFVISQTLSQQPQPTTAEFRIYNVHPDTMNAIKEEEQSVELEAGYEHHKGVIFKGQLRAKRAGRESQTDSFLRVVAATGDKAHVFGTMNTSLAAGTSPDDIRDAIMAAFGIQGLPLAGKAKTEVKRLARGKVFCGMGRDYLNGYLKSNNLQVTYSNEGLLLLGLDEALQDDPVKLNLETGLIGMPTITTLPTDKDAKEKKQAVMVTSLLRHELGCGSLIEICNAAIQEEKQKSSMGTEKLQHSDREQIIATDGVYKVISLEHVGDSRGKEWYTKMFCVRHDDQARKG